MAKTKTRPYDAAEYLETPEDMAAYLEAALEDIILLDCNILD